MTPNRKTILRSGREISFELDCSVDIHYECVFFSSGDFIELDSTVDRAPLSFRIGRGEAVPMLELCVRTMGAGELARFIFSPFESMGLGMYTASEFEDFQCTGDVVLTVELLGPPRPALVRLSCSYALTRRHFSYLTHLAFWIMQPHCALDEAVVIAGEEKDAGNALVALKLHAFAVDKYVKVVGSPPFIFVYTLKDLKCQFYLIGILNLQGQ